jgi:hypothetical protein
MEIVDDLFKIGLILPSLPDLREELLSYKIKSKFSSPELEKRKQLCPDLFMIGTNLVNGNFDLNLSQRSFLLEEFPGETFSTPEECQEFLNIPNFYLANLLDEIEGDDLLGNAYRDMINSIVFIQIIPGDPLGEYTPYSLEEIIMSFLYHMDYINPKRYPEKFNQKEIQRIKKLVSDLQHTIEPAKYFLDIIDTVDAKLNGRIKEITDIHPNESVKVFMDGLLKVGMMMRGLFVDNKYPLKSDQCKGKIDDSVIIEKLFELKEINSICLGLPLFKYRGGYEMSSQSCQGYTIGDRIDIILKNETTYSCIRMSSNWFTSTAHYYLNQYFNLKPFDIEKLDWIA